MISRMTDVAAWELPLRLVAAALLGGCIGFEREYRGQAAGFRTHILVSLGSALFTMVGAYAVAGTDPTRIAAQVVTGIGFLGAGAIVQQGVTVRGLTTAASLWVTAAIGMAVGLGYWYGALVAVATAILTLFGLKLLQESLFAGSPGHQQLLIETTSALQIGAVNTTLGSRGARLIALSVVPDSAKDQFVVIFRTPRGVRVEDVAADLVTVEGITHVERM